MKEIYLLHFFKNYVKVHSTFRKEKEQTKNEQPLCKQLKIKTQMQT